MQRRGARRGWGGGRLRRRLVRVGAHQDRLGYAYWRSWLRWRDRHSACAVCFILDRMRPLLCCSARAHWHIQRRFERLCGYLLRLMDRLDSCTCIALLRCRWICTHALGDGQLLGDAKSMRAEVVPRRIACAEHEALVYQRLDAGPRREKITARRPRRAPKRLHTAVSLGWHRVARVAIGLRACNELCLAARRLIVVLFNRLGIEPHEEAVRARARLWDIFARAR